jgi:hypothetical protein
MLRIEAPLCSRAVSFAIVLWSSLVRGPFRTCPQPFSLAVRWLEGSLSNEFLVLIRAISSQAFSKLQEERCLLAE